MQITLPLIVPGSGWVALFNRPTFGITLTQMVANITGDSGFVFSNGFKPIMTPSWGGYNEQGFLAYGSTFGFVRVQVC